MTITPSLIQPLQLGDRIFPVNIMQAPLAGYTCAAFRALLWRYSKPAFCVTEMISCKSLIYQLKNTATRYLAKDPEEGPVCFQLFGNNPQELAIATKIVTDHGADLIDLNCGCPVAKVRKQGAGSSLLTDPRKIYQLITAMKQNTTVPISIKVRIADKNDVQLNRPLIQAVSDAGADFLVVHGRHWTENYSAACHYDQIQFFVEHLKIPVIGNGNVGCYASLEKMLATGCAGAMVGRASIGQPWLIGKLIATARQQDFVAPTNHEIGLILIEHIAKLAHLFHSEKSAVLEARKMISHYARGLRNKRELCTQINSCETFADFKTICSAYFLDTTASH